MEPLKTLGKILETEEMRDAIHIAVAPVIAAHSLRPGDHVGLNEKGEADSLTGIDIGVIDPFLKAPVRRGQRCWLFLYPGSITSLRHEWMHPAFGGPQPPTVISKEDHLSKSEAWIAQHATRLGLTADVLMDDAEHWLQYEERKIQHNSERWRDNFEPTEFWHHYEVVTGKVIEQTKKQSFYCCTC